MYFPSGVKQTMSGRAPAAKSALISPLVSMTTIRRYSKSSAFYQKTKAGFFADNAKLLAKARTLNALYAEQPPRTKCKICQAALAAEVDFEQHGVAYRFCPDCGHLNGAHDDTRTFVEKLYLEDDSREYAENYVDTNFAARATDIYTPKFEFLSSHVELQGAKVLDIGCGGGHFVYAARKAGVEATGVDVSKTMVRYGNDQIAHLLNERPLEVHDEEGLFAAVRERDAKVVSAIGVIEHLREPQRLFEAFAASQATHLFYSVPMFSLSVLFEHAFQHVFPRQLSGGHTHLFTEDSLTRLHQLLGVEPIAEWRFGTDMMDLYRCLRVTLEGDGVSERLETTLDEGLGAIVDELQAVADKQHFCSEIHVVTTKIS